MVDNYSIYGLCDPHSGKIRYVGFSCEVKKRCATHLREARDYSKISHKLNWIRDLLKNGTTFQVVLIEESTHNPEVRERYWIQRLKERGCNLTNATDGGEGVLNLIPEVRKALRDKARARWADPAFKERASQKMRDAHKRPEVKQTRSRTSKLLWGDPAYRNKTTESVRKGITTLIQQDPEYKIRVAAGSRTYWANPEARKKQSERMLQSDVRKKAEAHWKDPAFRASFSKAVREAATPEWRAAISARVKGVTQSLETRKKVSNAAKAQWANPITRARIYNSLPGVKARKLLKEHPLRDKQDELPDRLAAAFREEFG